MIKVKIENFRQSTKYPGARSLRLGLGLKTVTTPTRVLTSSEIKRKRYVPTQIPLTNEIVILDAPINAEALVKPSSESNAKIRNVIKRLESFYGDLYGIHYLIPYVYPTGDKKERILGNKNLAKKALNTLSFIISPSINADYEFDIVCVPPLNIGYKDYVDALENLARRLEEFDQYMIPVIDISHPSFHQIIEKLVSTYNINVIGIKYRSIKNNLSHYAYIYNEFLDKDIAFLIVDVERRVRLGIKDFALPHYMPMLGFDLIATRLSYGGFPRKIRFDLRLLNRAKLQLPLIDELDNQQRRALFRELEVDLDHGMLGKMIRILVDQDLYEKKKHEIESYIECSESMIRRFAREEFMRLYSLTRIQEVKASTNEFSYLRNFIKSGEIDEYYNERTSLKAVVKRLKMPEQLKLQWMN